MRQDQFERLQGLTERLADQFFIDAEPADWSGAGKRPNQMDKTERGDAFWCKRNAVATLALLTKTIAIGDVVRGESGDPAAPGAVTDDEDDVDSEINAAEKEAAKLFLEHMQGRARASDAD